MLTAYEQYAAQTFDEAGIEVLLVGDSASQQRLRQRDLAAGDRRRADPAGPRGHPVGAPRAGRGRPAVRLLPGLARAGLPHLGPLHEGGQRARGEARGRPGDGAAGPQADRGRHPGDGAHRLHPAVRAQPRRLPGPGPRRRRRAGRSRRPRRSRRPAPSRSSWRWCPATSPPRSPRPSASPRSASAPASTATARCWSGRTPSGCAPAGWRSSSSSTPTCTAYSSRRRRTTPPTSRAAPSPGPEHTF